MQNPVTSACGPSHQIERSLPRWWMAIFVLAALYYLAWWWHLRPGIFTFDSGYYLQEIAKGYFTNLKPFLYARFLQLGSLDGRNIDSAVVLQVLLVALAASRMLAIGISLRIHPSALILAVAVLANPYVANMAAYVQNDALFCVAMVLVLVETLYAFRTGVVSRSTLLMVAIYSPMAFFFRKNGLFFLPLWVVLVAWLLPRKSWIALAGTALLASAASYLSVVGVHTEARQDPLFSVVIHEVVGLARPIYNKPIGTRLSPETRREIEPERLERAVSGYWPLYWDTIAFNPAGAMMERLSPDERRKIVHSFIRHDLFPNLPAIAGHRFEIFVGATLARGAAVNPYMPPPNLDPALHARKLQSGYDASGSLLLALNQASHRSRHWSWNAPGVLVLAGMTLLALWRHDRLVLGLTGLLWLQAALIAVFAPAAEYRYVFMLYLSPLLLLAAWPPGAAGASRRAQRHPHAVMPASDGATREAA